MSTIESVGQRIKQNGIIAIVRGDYSVDDMLRIGEALLAGTVTAMEVTMNSPAVLPALPRLRDRFRAEKKETTRTAYQPLSPHPNPSPQRGEGRKKSVDTPFYLPIGSKGWDCLHLSPCVLVGQRSGRSRGGCQVSVQQEG